MNPKFKIAITLPYLFSVRDFLFTPVWNEMLRREDVHFFLLTSHPLVKQYVLQTAPPNITCLNFPPADNSHLQIDYGWIKQLGAIDENYINSSLIYRFAAVHNLSHYKLRKEKSRDGQKRSQIIKEYSLGELAGEPYPTNPEMFQKLYDFHHLLPDIVWQEKDINFLKKLNPDLFVFGRLHLYPTAYWATLLRRLKIPMVGIVSSWDHPTTKNPTPRGMSRYVVASKRMVEEMTELHGVSPDKVVQVGKVQMDVYKNPSIFNKRDDFLKKLGIPATHRLVTMGPNTTGLKEHEVSIAQKLARNFSGGRYGKATLLIRTHPQDVNWKRDFLSLSNPPWVVCLDAASFGNRAADDLLRGKDDLIFLANLMKHSNVVIQSRGSLALDAIAFNTPVISLAFDGDLTRLPQDSFLLEYNYEHYKPLVSAQGTWIVGSYESLDQAVREYLRDPAIHNEGRLLICGDHIEPLDGKSSQRVVETLVKSAQMAKDGTLPDGDWHLTGLGDLTWASRQTVDVRDYVQKEISSVDNVSDWKQADNTRKGIDGETRGLPQAVTQTPVNSEKLISLGKLYYDTHRYEDSLNYFKKVIDIDSNNIEAWIGIALIARHFEDTVTFKAAFRQARLLDPTHPGLKKLKV